MRVALLLTLVALVSGCRGDCSFEPALKDAAGSRAVACGKASLDDYAAVGACMAQALASGDAFWGYKEGQGTDSTVGSGIACNGSEIWTFTYDSCPGGCLKADPHIMRADCIHPVADQNWIACDPAKAEPVCP